MDKQYEQNSMIIIAVVAVIMIFFGMGSIPLVDRYEPAYALAAREMLESGNWLAPSVFDKVWLDKSPLYFWLVAIAQAVFGNSEFAVRLPAGIMAFATCIILYLSITKLFNERAGFWTSIVLATSVEFFCLGKMAGPESTFVFFMTAVFLCFLHKFYWLMYVCMAFAALTEGLVGLFMPLAVILLYIICSGRLGDITRIHLVRGIILCLVIISPWYYAMYTIHGMEFVGAALGTSKSYIAPVLEGSNQGSVFYYLPILILGAFPWTGILLQSIFESVSISRIDDMRTLVLMHIWWGVTLLYYSFIQTKAVGNLLLAFPALAIIVGWNVARLVYTQRNNTKYYSWAITSLLLFIAVGYMVVSYGAGVRELALGSYVLGGITAILGVSVVVFLIHYKDLQLSASLHALMSMVAMITIYCFLLPEIAPRFSVKNIAEYYTEEMDQGIPLYVEKSLRPGMEYYGNRHGMELLPNSQAFSDALINGGQKNFIMRGEQFRELQKNRNQIEVVQVNKELGDCYVLEQNTTVKNKK